MRHIIAAAALALAAVLNLAALSVSAQTPNRAVVVVRQADGRVATRCVAFSEPSLSSYDLLRRAGFSAVAQFGSLGAAVCAIEGQGCPNPNRCFCACETLGASCEYWQFFRQGANGGWLYSPMGALTTRAVNGSVEAWVWGAGGAEGSRLVPPDVSVERACAAAPSATRAGPVSSAPPATARVPSTARPVSGATATAAASPAPSVPPATATATEPVREVGATATSGPTAVALAPEAATPSPAPPPTAVAPQEPVEAVPAPAAGEAPAADWGSYAVFGAIVAGLAVAIGLTRRRG